MNTMAKDSARGALLGLAVGDALGTTFEFDVIDQPPYPTLATEPATDVVGQGPFDLPAGAVTDDTQLAVCLAASLAGGALDVDDVARRYVAWSAHAFDIGNQTYQALSRIAQGEPPLSAGLDTWRASGRHAAGNGSLMRTAPIAVAFAAQGDRAVIEAAIRESAITHADPRCTLACAAFDVAIAAAIRDAPMLPAAREAIAHAAVLLRALHAPDEHDAIAVAARDLTSDLAAAEAADPGVYGDLHVHRTAGFVRVAFRLAFWHAVHTRSWRAALVDIASRGGDADTNAAIAGALLGARDGAGAIPEAWTLRVLSARLPGPDAWADAHHPRHLLQLLK